MIEWFSFLLIGVFAGLAAGLFGLGGGVVIVPALLWVLSWQSISSEHVMHIAVATSLMTIIVTSIASIATHHRQANIEWQIVIKLAPGLVLGAFLGAYIASSLSSRFLQTIFAVYLVLVALKMWLPNVDHAQNRLLNIPISLVVSTFIGMISAMVGIGGGSLTVPYLLMAKQTMYRAVGISAACGFPIALSAVISFIILAPDTLQHQWGAGFIHWQAFFGIISTSFIFAVIGAKWSKTLSMERLRQLFSIVLFIIAINLMQ